MKIKLLGFCIFYFISFRVFEFSFILYVGFLFKIYKIKNFIVYRTVWVVVEIFKIDR